MTLNTKQLELPLESKITQLGKYFWLSSMLPMQHIGTTMKPGVKEDIKQTFSFIKDHFVAALGETDWRNVPLIPDFDFWVHGVEFFELIKIADEDKDGEYGPQAKIAAASIITSYYALLGF